MVKNLKEFIRAIRSCKTASDERDTIAKESASIRNSFKDNKSNTRYKNIAKLLYIHMLGYPAHFGQIECLKLAASPKFSDKRLGYLGIMLLFDEHHETLTLVTNSLKNDMSHPNMYVVGLALSTFANISSSEMVLDLCPEVEKLLSHANPYIRKKAILCAVKIVKKVPGLADTFIHRTKYFFSERNHAILLTAIELAFELCSLNLPTIQDEYRELIPRLCHLLQDLLGSESTPDYNVEGIVDPFLQVSILRLLRVLGEGQADVDNSMKTTLSQVVSSTDSTKTVGCAILYEAVVTIMNIHADATLLAASVNILSKFLSNKDNNMRYVALNILVKMVQVDLEAVQRHQNTILQCIHDPDISIKRRALDLTFAIVDLENVEFISKEMMKFLATAEPELIPSTISKLSLCIDGFSKNTRWSIETILSLFKLGESFVKEESIHHFINRVGTLSPSTQNFTAFTACSELCDPLCSPSMDGLLQCCSWCIGEYRDCLSSPGSYEGKFFQAVDQEAVIHRLSYFLAHERTLVSTKYYLLMALNKLSIPWSDHSSLFRSINSKFTTHVDVELQQRAMEYQILFDNPSLKASVLEPMPSLTLKPKWISGTMRGSKRGEATNIATDLDLLSLQSDFVAEEEHTDTLESPLSSTSKSESPPPLLLKPVNKSNVGSQVPMGEFMAYSRNGLDILFHQFVDSSDPSIITVKVIFTNNNEFSLNHLLFQVAVPKVFTLHMNPSSSTSVQALSQTYQILKLTRPDNMKPALRLRMKISYTVDDDLEEVSDTAEFSFPETE